MISNTQKKDIFLVQKKIAKKILRVLIGTTTAVIITTPIITNIVYDNQYKFIKKEMRLFKKEDKSIVSNFSNFYFDSKNDNSNGLYNYGVIKSYSDLVAKTNTDLAYFKIVDINFINNAKTKITSQYNEDFFKEYDLIHVNYHLIDVSYFLTSDIRIKDGFVKIPYLNTKTIFEKEYTRDNYYLNANDDDTKTEIKFFKIKKTLNIKDEDIDVFEIKTPFDVYNYSKTHDK